MSVIILYCIIFVRDHMKVGQQYHRYGTVVRCETYH